MKFKKTLLLATLSLTSLSAAEQKQEPTPPKIESKTLKNFFSVGVRLGAYGLPKYHAVLLEAILTLNDTFRFRLIGGGFYHAFDTLYFNNVRYNRVRLNLKNAGLVADWHLFKNGIRVTGGFYANGNTLELRKTGAPLPGVSSSISAATTIASHFKYRFWAPYLGVGYDTPILGKSGVSFSVDAGFMFQGKARATTHFEGPFATLLAPAVSTARVMSEQVINSNKWLRTIPIITLGIRYNFV